MISYVGHRTAVFIAEHLSCRGQIRGHRHRGTQRGDYQLLLDLTPNWIFLLPVHHRISTVASEASVQMPIM